MAKKESNKKSVTGSINFQKWFGDSKIVDENNHPLVVFHATTHKFYEFTRERGNIENHFGLGYYFTSSYTDAETNYLSEGADLTSRIEQLSDRLESDGLDREKAKLKAKKLLKGKHEIVLPFYLKMVNPINLTDNRKYATYYDSLETEDEDGNYVENNDSLPMKLYNSIMSVSYDFYGNNIDAQSVFNDISEKVGYEWDGVSAYDVDKAFRESEQLMDAYDDNGSLANHEFIRRVYEDMGFDGIIMDAYKEFGGGRKVGKQMVMDYDTLHYIAFEPNQIKLADGKNTTFDENNPDIRFGKGGSTPSSFEYSIGGL